MKEIKIQTLSFLGRGSMFNVAEGNTSAYWKNDDGDCMVLIDCGCTVFQKIMALNLLDGIESLVIAITHTHTDHVGSLSDLVHYCVFCKPQLQVSILAHQKTLPYLRSYLDCTGTSAVMRNSNVKVCHLTDKARITSGYRLICTVEFILDKSHVVKAPTNMVGQYNCGILIKFKHKTIYYSGDTMRIPYGSLSMDNIDELYVDCAVRNHSPGSEDPYPHYNLFNMIGDLKFYGYPLDQVYAMHIDCDGVIDQCNMLGVNLVKVEEDL